MLGNPNLPVYSEEIQCRGLGMKVEIYNDQGESVVEEVGELVCTAPFPSMPVSFWNDPDNKRYRESYFEHFPGIWRHGDYARITERGGVVVYGRSDATLNPGGVRIGTAEIYNPVEALNEVVDSLVIGHQHKGDTRIVLFVVLAEGLQLTEELREKIRRTVRENATARHVPSVIIQAEQVPHTLNGKKVEIAATRVVHGQSVANRDALANPEALDHLRDLAAQHLKNGPR
jgi:acetoacetyl-CoA synthetase